MAENSSETPQVNPQEDFQPDDRRMLELGRSVSQISLGLAKLIADVRAEERARCAAIARAKKAGRFADRISDDVWKGACDLIAEAIERGEP